MEGEKASRVMTDYERALHDGGVQKNENLELGGFLYGYRITGFDQDRAKFIEFRYAFIKRFSFAIPNDEALTVIASQDPILEIGAGAGYWAYEIAKRGVDIVSTDINPVPEGGRNEGGLRLDRSFHPVLKMNALEALTAYPKRALLIIWPSFGGSWASEAIDAYQGRTIIYVGEKENGCCADDHFFTLLYERFEPHKNVKIPQWECIHDQMTVFTRI
jgi:hypothetical protein